MLTNLLTEFQSIKFMGKEYAVASEFTFLQTIFNIISYAMVPLFIAVAAAGSIYAIVLGVNLARAEDAERRQNAKQRLIWAIVGIVAIVVLIILLNWICKMIPDWVSTYANGDTWKIDNGTIKTFNNGKWN